MISCSRWKVRYGLLHGNNVYFDTWVRALLGFMFLLLVYYFFSLDRVKDLWELGSLSCLWLSLDGIFHNLVFQQ